MASDEWTAFTVSDVAAPSRNSIVGGPFGSELVSKDYVAQGVPVIRGSNMGHGRWVDGEFAFVTETKADLLSANCAEPGDLIFTQRGTLGQVALVPPKPFKRYLISQSQMKLRVDETKADKLFLYYLFTSDEQQAYIRRNAIRVGVPHTNLGILRRTPIRLPGIKRQKAIARILGMLDDKIELNQMITTTLEATAWALFRSWFVDFDLCHGSDPLSKLEFRRLYPTKLVQTLEGLIPKGWQTRSLDAMAVYLNGLALQKYPAKDGPTLPVIKIAQLRKGGTEGADKCSAGIPQDYIIQDGDVLFSWSGTLEVELWCGGTGALNQHLFKVTSQEFPKWFSFLWTRHHLDTFRRIAASKATTMGHIQRRHLTEAKVLVPSPALLEAMTHIMEPLIDKIIANRLQSRTLAELRNTLLPKLLSGEVKAPELAANDHEH